MVEWRNVCQAVKDDAKMAGMRPIGRPPKPLGFSPRAEVAEMASGRKTGFFWDCVDKKAPGECWPWLANKFPNGYGLLRLGNKRALAHRVAWEICNGPIPNEMFVCHTCDLPSCVNPLHLFLGTHFENMRDMISKGRGARGESHGHAKLTAEQVREIRSAHAKGVLQKDLADEFRMSKMMVSLIVRRKNWAHLP